MWERKKQNKYICMKNSAENRKKRSGINFVEIDATRDIQQIEIHDDQAYALYTVVVKQEMAKNKKKSAIVVLSVWGE